MVQIAKVKADGNFADDCNPSLDLYKGKRILVLVHGYNADEKRAVDAYHEVRGKVHSALLGHGKIAYDAVIGYLWPSKGSALNYFPAKENVELSAVHLRDQLEKLCALATKVDVLAHSMGNRVALEAMNHMKGDKPVQNFFSLAAAIDNEAVQKNGRYAKGVEKCERVYAFHSRDDDSLKYLYQLAEFDKAFGYSGAEDSNELADHVQVLDCSEVVDGHLKYRSSPEIYEVARKILLGQVPSAQQLKVLPGGQIEVISGDRRSLFELFCTAVGSIFC